MTPRYPGAIFYPAGPDLGANNGPVSFSWHGAITSGSGIGIAGWNSSDGPHCHGFVERHGKAYLYVDLDRAVYGALDGNYRGVVTWETWDGLNPATAGYPDVNAGEWTDEQCERIADIIAWADIALGIPIQRLHGTRSAGHGPHGTGIPHRTTSDGINLYEGPDRWSVDNAKPCPGDLRILQLYGPALDGGAGSILQRARTLAAGIRTGIYGFLPQGDVDLSSAQARGGSGEFDVLEWILEQAGVG